MIYLVGIVGVAVLLLGASLKFEHAKNASLTTKLATCKAETADCRAANKSLAESIADVRKRCDESARKFKDQHRLDLIDKGKTKAALDTLKAKEKPEVIAELDTRARGPAVGSQEEQCAKAEKVLDELAKWRNP